MKKVKLCWKQITNPRIRERYQELVSKEISNHRTDVSFNDIQDIDDVISKLNNTLENSANKTIPKRKFKACLKPYWNADFKQLHFKLRVCRREWLGAGKPRSKDNEFFKRYKDAKREFRKQLRRKAMDEEVKENGSLHCAFEMNRTQFHKRIGKKRKGNGKHGNVLKIDGQLITETTDVLEVWKDHYKELYSPLRQDSFDEQFKEFVEKKIEEYSIKSLEVDIDPLQYPFEMKEVAEVCRNLPNGKASGLDGIQYEHFKYAGEVCWNLLTRIFNFIRECEQLPESVTVGVILSLFKGKKKSKLSKENYRGITLLNVIGKILERLILNRSMETCNASGVPNKLQFAYQKSNSSDMASFVLQEVINEYKEEKSTVYSCFLDSSRAFDTVWIDGLFYKLYNIGIRGKMWRLLRNWYNNMSCCVLLDGFVSETFPVSQGIRQGGVLSPWLYMCFNNDILESLNEIGCGVMVESIGQINNVTVADDVALISPRVNGLQRMINKMEDYSNKWRFTFNPSKTFIVTFGESTRVFLKNKEMRTWYLYNKPIEEKQHCEHVGILLSGNFSSHKRTQEMVSRGKEAIASLMSAGVRPGGLNPICAAEIWKSVGLPKMLYACQLWWNLSQTDKEDLERVNRLAAKRAQGLCASTKSEAALGSLGLWTVEGLIDKQKLFFLQKLVSSPVRFIHKQLFVKRLCRFLNHVVSRSQGFIADVVKILQKYDLQQYLMEYMDTGDFPHELAWKRLVRNTIHSHQVQRWQTEMTSTPELYYYSIIHHNFKPLDLWYTALRNPIFVKTIANAVNVISGNVPVAVMSLVETKEDGYYCQGCSRSINNVAYHYMIDCPIVSQEREYMWERLYDRLPVQKCAQLLSGDDESIYCNLFNTDILVNEQHDKHIIDDFLIIVAQGLMNIFKKVVQTNESRDNGDM